MTGLPGLGDGRLKDHRRRSGRARSRGRSKRSMEGARRPGSSAGPCAIWRLASLRSISTSRPPRRPTKLSAAHAEAGFKVALTGVAHGTVTLIVDGRPFETTTLREDVETDGRWAKVAFGRDFAADARRRDFTINALSLSADGTVHDYVGGLEDLRAGRVRFIGDAEARIREDYLRILRFFRFSARFAEAGLTATAFRRRSAPATASRGCRASACAPNS